MNNCNNCNNCAWYCHSDGKCYGSITTIKKPEFCLTVDPSLGCSHWTFDGLEDWEREE